MIEYQVRKIGIEDAYNMINQFSYGLVYYISKMELYVGEQLKTISEQEQQLLRNECIEARFFSEEKELHIFDIDGEKKAVLVEDLKEFESGKENVQHENQTAERIIKRYELTKRFKNKVRTCVVQEYIKYDSDGQLYVALTRLKGIE